MKAGKTKWVEMELAALRNQMNPHFIFNNLNSINSFIVNNDTKLASLYLTKFSRLMRLILDNSRNEEISLHKELETLNLYLTLEAIRFKNKFTYLIHVDDNIDEKQIKLPPTTLQPFVENAIWHGIMHLTTKGALQIDIKFVEVYTLLISIKDNGIGRKQSVLLKSKTHMNKTYGLEMAKERLLQMHSMNRVEVEDNLNANGECVGTTVLIYMQTK
jgi:LytS/YehU family sensor histidine kinase